LANQGKEDFEETSRLGWLGYQKGGLVNQTFFIEFEGIEGLSLGRLILALQRESF